MNNEYRKGYVYVQDYLAGIIEETEIGYRFTYDTNYLNNISAKSISLTMPLSKNPYESTVLFPFFDGLIPEGWLLNVVVKNWKLQYTDRFGLLLVACKDCIGDVSIRNEVIS